MIYFRFQLQQFEFCSTILSGTKKNWWKGITQTIPKQYLQKLKLCLHTVKPVQSHVLSHQDLGLLNVKYVTWLYPRPWVFTFLHTFHAFNYFDVSCYECFISYTFLVHQNQCCQLLNDFFLFRWWLVWNAAIFTVLRVGLNILPPKLWMKVPANRLSVHLQVVTSWLMTKLSWDWSKTPRSNSNTNIWLPIVLFR